MVQSPCLRPLTVLAAGTLTLLAATSTRAQDLPRVTVAPAEETELIEELPLTGTLTAPQTALLAPEVAGRLETIAVDAGDRIEAGAQLATLDDELARLELAAAGAVVEEARAELDDARRRLRDTRELAERQSVAESDLRAREAEVKRDRAVLERRRAEQALQAAMVERHALKAPFDGVIARRMQDAGERVDTDTPVFELVQIDRLRLDLRVPQRHFGRVTRATTARIRLDALPQRTLEARVATVVPVSDPDARTFLVRIDLPNTEERMTPGMSARATLKLNTGRTGVVVPRDALIRYPDGRVSVWIAEGAGSTRTVTERRIETGLKFNGRVAVKGGLEAGVPVVVEGNEALQEGQQVHLQDGG